MRRFALEVWTYRQIEHAASTGKWVVLLPTGSTEPHGPHMGLGVDTAISLGVAELACEKLEASGFTASIAPSINYGVTDCAEGFAGAISIPAGVLKEYIGSVASGWLDHGAAHVCLVNNHLEPGHYKVMLDLAKAMENVSVSCPLERSVGRLLTDEYKSGACHAGQYETSIIMACEPDLVRDIDTSSLPSNAISLSEHLQKGVSKFKDMGIMDAYAGSPKDATKEEGERSLEILANAVSEKVQSELNK